MQKQLLSEMDLGPTGSSEVGLGLRTIIVQEELHHSTGHKVPPLGHQVLSPETANGRGETFYIENTATSTSPSGILSMDEDVTCDKRTSSISDHRVSAVPILTRLGASRSQDDRWDSPVQSNRVSSSIPQHGQPHLMAGRRSTVATRISK